MTQKSIIIIGAGIAGLSAGCYAQMNGFRTKIFELHDLPGGLCTAWERKGYIFDGCIHYLFGSGAGPAVQRHVAGIGRAAGPPVYRPRRVHAHQPMGSTRSSCTPTRTGWKRTCSSFRPQDAQLIRAFCAACATSQQFECLPCTAGQTARLMTPQDWAAIGQKMLPFLAAAGKWGTLSMRRVRATIQGPLPAPRRGADVLLG